MSKLRVTVSQAQCQSYKRCTAMAPAVFAIGTEGKAVVHNPAGASPEEVVKAARSCPYRAITVVVEGTAEQLFPPPLRAPPPQA